MNIIFKSNKDEFTASIDTDFLENAGEVFNDFDEDAKKSITAIVGRIISWYLDDFCYDDFNIIEEIGEWNCMDEKREMTGKENIRMREYMNNFWDNISFTVTFDGYTACIHDEREFMKDWYIDFNTEEAFDKGYYVKAYIFN